jgi:hypothetical protein
MGVCRQSRLVAHSVDSPYYERLGGIDSVQWGGVLGRLPLKELVAIAFCNHLNGVILGCWAVETMPKSLADNGAI